MRSLGTPIAMMLAVAGLLSVVSPSGADVPRMPAEVAGVETARRALDLAASAGPNDIVPKQDLLGARADEIFVVRDPGSLEPVYGVVPVHAPDGRFVGLVGVTPDGTRWLWFNFHCPYKGFPPVAGAEAGRRVATARAARGQYSSLEEPLLIAGRDKHLYWRVEAGRNEAWFVNAVVAAAPTLNSLDGSDARALEPLESLRPPERTLEPMPEPRGLGVDMVDMAPAAIPPGYNIPGVPYHFQITDWYCGPASLQMIMDYYGEEIGQNNIADVADDVVNDGTMSDNMRRAAHFSGMSVAIQDPTLQGYRERLLGYACVDANFFTSQASRLKNTVYAQYPVFTLTWFDGSHGAGHYRVVKGYDDNLNAFIIHDPWYAGALCGPDLIINQDYFVTDLWAYSGWWCMLASPWVLTPTVPATAAVGETVSVRLDVCYPGPTRFKDIYPCTACRATISLPAGLALAGGPPTVSLPDMYSDDTVTVDWDVLVVGPEADWGLAFQAQGLLQSSSQSYPAYSDTIGGQAYETIAVGSQVVDGWGPEERLTSDAASSATCLAGSRAMAADEAGNLHLVWAETRDTAGEIYYQERLGGAWQPALRLTNDPAFSDAACLAIGPDGSVHVAWVDQRDGNQEIYYKRWDQVTGWSADERVTVYGEVDHCPSLAVGGGLVYLAWERRLGGAYRVAAVEFSTRSGTGWSAPVDVDGSPTRDSYRPSVAVGADGLVHVVYERQTSSTPNEREKIIHRSWNGSAWSAVTGLSSELSFSRNPCVAAGADSTVHVVWQDGENLNGDIFYTRFDGSAWQPADEIAAGGTEASTPSVAVAPSGNVYVAWQDNRQGESEIYFLARDESGWSGETRLSRSRGASMLPTVVADDQGHVCVVWTDLRNGNAEIYFRGGEDLAAVARGSGGPERGAVIHLSRPYPTPFADRTRVALTLGERARVSLEIFDVRGRLASILASGEYGAGTYDFAWDGRSLSGEKASPGVYFVVCRSPRGEAARRVVLVR